MGRTYEEIKAEREQGKVYSMDVPPVRCSSGVRFGYRKKIDYESFDRIRMKEKALYQEHVVPVVIKSRDGKWLLGKESEK